jgi:hypothetical protein
MNENDLKTIKARKREKSDFQVNLVLLPLKHGELDSQLHQNSVQLVRPHAGVHAQLMRYTDKGKRI